MNTAIIINCLFACILTLMSISLLRPLAIRIGLVDAPGGRKQHRGDIPLIGGVAMFAAFTFALLTLNISLYHYRSFIAASALLVFVGILDDFHELTPKARIIAQILAALLMAAWGQNQIHSLGDILFLGDLNLYDWSLPLTVIAVVGVINSLNMIDGIDGLAGTLALIEYGFLALLAGIGHRYVDLEILLLLMFALFGFLVFNFHIPGRNRKTVFMGDAGSMFIGFSLAWFLISLSQGRHPSASPVTMLWIMAIPLFDTGRLIIRRICEKKSPFMSSTDHIHHLLARRKFTPVLITLLLTICTLLLAIIGVTGYFKDWSQSIMFLVLIGIFIGYYFIVEKVLKCQKT